MSDTANKFREAAEKVMSHISEFGHIRDNDKSREAIAELRAALAEAEAPGAPDLFTPEVTKVLDERQREMDAGKFTEWPAPASQTREGAIADKPALSNKPSEFIEQLFQAANTAATNLATSMKLGEHPESCECYGCGLQLAVVNFALDRARENVRPIVERELRAERWPALATHPAAAAPPTYKTGDLAAALEWAKQLTARLQSEHSDGESLAEECRRFERAIVEMFPPHFAAPAAAALPDNSNTECAVETFDGAEDTIGYSCTLPRGHSGDHVAHGFNGRVLHMWAAPACSEMGAKAMSGNLTRWEPLAREGMSEPQPIVCVCSHDRESHSEEMPYECNDDCDCRAFTYPQRPT